MGTSFKIMFRLDHTKTIEKYFKSFLMYVRTILRIFFSFPLQLHRQACFSSLFLSPLCLLTSFRTLSTGRPCDQVCCRMLGGRCVSIGLLAFLLDYVWRDWVSFSLLTPPPPRSLIDTPRMSSVVRSTPCAPCSVSRISSPPHFLTFLTLFLTLFFFFTSSLDCMCLRRLGFMSICSS